MTLANTLTWDGHHKVGAEGIANSRVIWWNCDIQHSFELRPPSWSCFTLLKSRQTETQTKTWRGQWMMWLAHHEDSDLFVVPMVSMDIRSHRSQPHSAKGTIKTWYVSFWILAVTLDLESSQRECITTFEVHPNSKSPNKIILYNVCPVPLSWLRQVISKRPRLCSGTQLLDF